MLDRLLEAGAPRQELAEHPERSSVVRATFRPDPARGDVRSGDDPPRRRRYPGTTATGAGKGVNGLDSGCRSRGSVPRKATMISLTTRRKKTSAANKQHAQKSFALAA